MPRDVQHTALARSGDEATRRTTARHAARSMARQGMALPGGLRTWSTGFSRTCPRSCACSSPDGRTVCGACVCCNTHCTQRAALIVPTRRWRLVHSCAGCARRRRLHLLVLETDRRIRAEEYCERLAFAPAANKQTNKQANKQASKQTSKQTSQQVALKKGRANNSAPTQSTPTAHRAPSRLYPTCHVASPTLPTAYPGHVPWTT